MVPITKMPSKFLWFLPVLIIIALLNSSYWMWQDARILSYELLRSESNNAVVQIKTRLEIYLFERGKDITHLASLRQKYPLNSFLEQFKFDATGIISREKSYFAISYVDSSGKIIIRTGLDTLKNSAPIFKMDLNDYMNMIKSDTEMILVTLPSVPDFKEEILALLRPVFVKSSSKMVFIGAIIASLREKSLIENIITPSILKSNYVMISLGDTLLYSNDPSLKFSYKKYEEKVNSSETVHAMNRNFKITVFPPSNGLLKELIGQNDKRFILMGLTSIVASLLLATALYISNRLRLITCRLAKSEQQYRYLAENASDIILQQSIPDGVYDYVSPAAERLTGYKVEEFYKTPFLFEKIIAPDDLERYKEQWQKTLGGAPSAICEYKIRHKSGEIRWLNQRSSLMYDNSGQLIAVEGILTDITVQKKAAFERENLIIELESKNRDLERFTYIISHELKTPLITIKGFLGYLEDEATKGDLSGFHQDVLRIVTATETMGKLLNDLVLLNRIGHPESKKENVDLNKLVNECINQFSGQIEKKTIKMDVSKGLPQVVGFREELIELFRDLIDNSIKFTSGQKSPYIEIGVEKINGEEVIFIKDNGIGFEEKYSERIFGLFNKLDSETIGTGAGLALVKRIVEHHGGWIHAKSAGIGKGAVIRFFLPQNNTNK